MQGPDDDKTQTYVPLTSGMMVSHYRIIENIGAGGMGEAYLVDDTKLDRRVSLRFLPCHLCQELECRVRFTREAQAAALCIIALLSTTNVEAPRVGKFSH